MPLSAFIKRLFGGKDKVGAAGAEAPVVFIRRPELVTDGDEAPGIWTARDAHFWPERTARVIKHLRNDWSSYPDRGKWPDATELLTLLAAPPDEVIRQLPAAARDAIALCDNAALSRSQLGEKLSRDPSLVQALLKQANGAFHGAGLAPVLRVDTAVDRIGIAATRAIVLASCVDGLLSKPGGPYDGMLAAVWTHMVNTGHLAKLVAPTLGADIEEAFAISLLHDVGKLVIFDRISSLRASKRSAVALPEAWLNSLIEHLHEPLGAVAVQRWGLGARAADAIGSHHRRERPALQHPLAETLFVAERADHAIRKDERLDFEGIWNLGQIWGDRSDAQAALYRRVKAA
ncbi:MAG: HDOD domain-containing protein [Gemmatimonadaceae bacterium]